MPYTFSKVELHLEGMKPSVYGWCYVVTDLLSFCHYQDSVHSNRLAKAFTNASQALAGNEHYGMIGYTAKLIAENNNESLVGGFGILNERFFNGVTEMLTKYGKVYFQRSGGYFPHYSTGIKVIETKQFEKLVWPIESVLTLKDITIARWPEGKHWYITTKEGVSITDGDMTKFNTYEYAEGVAKKYIEKYNKKNNHE